jgi:hypothetical protein
MRVEKGRARYYDAGRSHRADPTPTSVVEVTPGLGATSARAIEMFFAAHLALTERARALIATSTPGSVVPWEQLRPPREVDGSTGTFRAPRQTYTLDADNDYAAIQG